MVPDNDAGCQQPFSSTRMPAPSPPVRPGSRPARAAVFRTAGC